MSIDVTGQIDALTREVSEREHEGKPRRVVTATRTYATSPEDLWDAITRPERLARWFSTVTGDLRLGGRFKTTDSVSGTRASDDWCRAEIASGESSAKANKRAARAFAFYSRGAGH